jgi:hypothetical protein
MQDGGIVYPFGDLPIKKIPVESPEPSPEPEQTEVDLGIFGPGSIEETH